MKKRLALFNKRLRLKRVNDKNQNDRFEKLKAKYEHDIKAAQRELLRLKASYATLLSFGREADGLDKPDSEPSKYAGKGVTEAVIDALRSIWPAGASDRRGATAREIADYMIANGFTPSEENPHNFNIAVAVTLKRLSEQGRVKKTEDEGSNFFRPGILLPTRRNI